jgi:hypothetical protein
MSIIILSISIVFFFLNSIFNFILKWTKIGQKIHCAPRAPAQLSKWMAIRWNKKKSSNNRSLIPTGTGTGTRPHIMYGTWWGDTQ